MAPNSPPPGAQSDAALSHAALRRLFFRIFPAVGLAMFGAALDQTIVAAALPAIARSVGEVERISWVVVAYLVGTTIAAPVHGRLGDAFGRRRMLLVSLALYATGAMLCAVAPTLDTLALARLVQGLGGGGLISLSIALIGEFVPPRERGRFQAWIAAIFAAASAAGPVVGGLLTEWIGWRAVFMVQPPLALGAAWLVIRRLDGVAPGSAKGFAFDWLGLALFVLFVAPTLLALDQLRRLAPGPLAVAAGLGALAALALVLLWRQERRAADPLLPLQVLGEPSIWRANLSSALVSGAFVGAIAFLPIYFVAVRGLSPAASGLALLPLAAAAALGAIASGQLLARTGRTMIWPTIGLTLAAAIMAGVALSTGALAVPVVALLLGLASIALGTSFPMVQVVVQFAAGRDRLGAATASVQFIRSLGAASGTALMGTVLFGSLVAHGGTGEGGGDAAALFVALVNQGPDALAGLAETARAEFREAMTGAFRAAFLAAALMLAGAAWLSARVPLQRV